MQRIAIGDPHLSGFESDKLDSTDLPLRLGYIIKSLDWIVDYGKKRNIFSYDILGDLINDKSVISTVAQDCFKDFLVRNKDCNFTIISGNHDLSSTGTTQRSAICVFGEYSNVHVIPYEPEVIGNITYIPYSHDFINTIKSMKSNSILISHVGLFEAVLQSGLSRVDKATLKDIRGFKLAILGHYHKPQEFENEFTKVVYPGNLITSNWNDKNETKRIIVYDTDSLVAESVPISCGIPEFREYVIETEDQKNEILKQAEISQNQGHHVRIRNKTKEKIETTEESSIIVVEQQEIDITQRGINITQGKDEQFKRYMEIKEIPEVQRAEYLNIIAKYDLLRNKDKK